MIFQANALRLVVAFFDVTQPGPGSNQDDKRTP